MEAQAPTADDLTHGAGRWFADTFGVVPRLATYVADLDAAVDELAAKGIATAPAPPGGGDGDQDGDDVPIRRVRVIGPSGLTVDLVQPAPAGHHEARITEFIDSAADLEGPPTTEVAASVLAAVTDAWDAIEAHLEGVAHNKVLAAQLLLSQQSRSEAPDAPEYWQRSAASTLLSWFVGRGVADASSS